MKLNKNNYFTAKNTLISSSKIKDYLLSPQYYKAKHIDHTIIEEPTDPMIVGSMTEMILDTGTFSSVFSKYNVMSRRSKDNEDPRIQVTEAMFNEASELADAVMKTEIYKELKGFKKQVILQSGNLCGALDFLDVANNGVATIVDLKTAPSVDEKKYYYHALDLGYYIQAACYVKLVRECYKDIKEVKFIHLVVEKDPKKIHRVKTYLFDKNKIEDTIKEVEILVDEISKRKDWSPERVALDTAQLLRNPKQGYGDEMESLGDIIL